jgi:hypothetical protein
MNNGLIDAEGFPDTTADIEPLTVADRAGRTVRLPIKYTDIGPIADQKRWLDVVGPLAASFTVWNDFFAYGGGVYRRITGTISVNGQPNFGIVWDGRPFWIGRFSRADRDQVLFYYPGDDNWWLGVFNPAAANWTFAGNTAGFGHAINDGRPYWIGDFSGDGRSDVLMYYPGDDNWWLGRHDGNTLVWSDAGNTAGFGHAIYDGRPFWIGRFSRADRDEVLMYYPGDGNWWCGTYDGNQLEWSLCGNTGTPNTVVGGHCVLVVGYHDPDTNDPDGYWIVKNSWGTGWGELGFGKIAYGESDIDAWAKTGLTGSSPDPWSKRRNHAGNLLESGNGAMRRNFEMISTGSAGKLRQWWRDNDASPFNWHQMADFGSDDVATTPSFIASTYNRNYEVVYSANSGRLHHWYYSQQSGGWRDGGAFGPVGVSGAVGFVQNNRHAAGDFELVVRTSDSRMTHLIRHNGHPWTRQPGQWFEARRFGNNIQLGGATLVQARRISSLGGTVADLHFVCVTSSGVMEHWQFVEGGIWTRLATFGVNVRTAPCMILSQVGMSDETGLGTLQLCVAVDGVVQTWQMTDWASGTWKWTRGPNFGDAIGSVVGLVEGSFDMNLEVVVVNTGNQLQHYWRDSVGWHVGPIIGNAF